MSTNIHITFTNGDDFPQTPTEITRKAMGEYDTLVFMDNPNEYVEACKVLVQWLVEMQYWDVLPEMSRILKDAEETKQLLDSITEDIMEDIYSNEHSLRGYITYFAKEVEHKNFPDIEAW